jgi:Family of unknown function (DUF6326)
MLVHADMTRAKDHVRSLNVLDDSAMSVKARISVLWGAATLLYLYGDVIAFYSPGGLQRMLDGKMGPWPVTPILLLGVAILMSAPAVMVALTVLLKPVASRWLNVVMGAAYTAIMLFTMIAAWKSDSYFYIYLGVVEVVLTLLVVWYALTWPRQPLMKTA